MVVWGRGCRAKPCGSKGGQVKPIQSQNKGQAGGRWQVCVGKGGRSGRHGYVCGGACRQEGGQEWGMSQAGRWQVAGGVKVRTRKYKVYKRVCVQVVCVNCKSVQSKPQKESVRKRQGAKPAYVCKNASKVRMLQRRMCVSQVRVRKTKRWEGNACVRAGVVVCVRAKRCACVCVRVRTCVCSAGVRVANPRQCACACVRVRVGKGVRAPRVPGVRVVRKKNQSCERRGEMVSILRGER